MSLRCSKDWRVVIPRILEFLKLPSLTSLVVDAAPELPALFSGFPTISFGEPLPTLAKLPEMEVYLGGGAGQVRFRSPSQAVLDHWAIGEPSGRAAHS
jgi:hypothetical protein